MAISVDLPILLKKPVIDGKVTPEEMEDSAIISTMTLMGGLEKPAYQTASYMFIATDALYVGFHCEEPNPSKIVTKTQRENGAVFTDDSVQLLITGTNQATKTNYYHFAVNAAGMKYSNAMNNDEPVAGWQAAASRTQNGWDAEMMIPIQGIRGSVSSAHWRANVARYRPARDAEPEETSVWINPGVTLHNYQRFGFLRLIRNPYPELTRAYGVAPPPVKVTGVAASETTGSLSTRSNSITTAPGTNATTSSAVQMR